MSRISFTAGKFSVPDYFNVNAYSGEPRTGFSMGEHAELMAREWGIPREEQDQLAVASHANLARAYKDGFFADLITPFKGVSKDNNLREGLTIEKLRSLKPCFDKKIAPGQGTLTPGNSTPLTDGASAVLLGSEEWARANNLPVLAYITFSEVAAVDFFNKKEGLLMAPAYAVSRMLQRAGLTLQDFDYYEIHEAFAAQAIAVARGLGLDMAKTNPKLLRLGPTAMSKARRLVDCGFDRTMAALVWAEETDAG